MQFKEISLKLGENEILASILENDFLPFFYMDISLKGVFHCILMAILRLIKVYSSHWYIFLPKVVSHTWS